MVLNSFPLPAKTFTRAIYGILGGQMRGYGLVRSCNDLNIQNMASRVKACPGNAEEFQSPLSS